MSLLLDTHIFLWYITADDQLPESAQDAIRDPANASYLSVASVWEAVIKYDLGKLPLPGPPAPKPEAETWQARLQRLTGIDPLVCTACGQPTMRCVESLAPIPSGGRAPPPP